MDTPSSFQPTLEFDTLDLDLVVKVLKNTAFSEHGYSVVFTVIKFLPLDLERPILHILYPGALLVTKPELECTHCVLEHSLVPSGQLILLVIIFLIHLSFLVGGRWYL